MGDFIGKHKHECFVLGAFAVTYFLLTFFHEPWFDEAQAWQIARCANIKDLLFTIPHYEGHPPLWWLILSIPAKIGIPFEITLKTIGFVISVGSAYLLVFRSQLPKLIRFLLPFSFFFFYQYGIIVRPYGLMLFFLMLLGQIFHKRNEKPWMIVIIMMLICLLSAYGIVIAGGISICILWELLREKGIKKLVCELFYDQRTFSLFALLICAVLVIIEIFPKKDTLVISVGSNMNSPLLSFFCSFFTFLSDCFITDSSWFRTDTVLLQNADISIPDLLGSTFFGIMIWVAIISISSVKNLKFFVVPYFLFALFSALVYVEAHHVGIALMILLFWLEVNAENSKAFEIGQVILGKISQNENDKKILKRGVICFVTACLLVPVYWTISASIRDVQLDYSYGRSASSIIKKFDFEKCLILSSWGDSTPKKYGERMGHDDYINTYDCGNSVLICAYLDHNVISNLGDGSDKEAYMHYRVADYDLSVQTMKKWSANGVPDLLIGTPELKALFGNTVSMSDYSLVFAPEANYIWKNHSYTGYLPIFLRNDLLGKYHLEPLNDPKYIMINGLSITEEMREAYENGAPIEEIIAPYIDAMFGNEK